LAQKRKNMNCLIFKSKSGLLRRSSICVDENILMMIGAELKKYELLDIKK